MPSINSPTPDATTVTKGKIQLAGDLSGTAALPTIAANAVSISRLNFTDNTDIASGLALTNGAWTDLKGNQSFTVDSVNSVIAISITGGCGVGTTAGVAVASRIQIDSAGTPINRQLGSIQIPTGNTGYPFVEFGTVYVTGLSAGSHTVKTQLYVTAASMLAYCRALTVPNTEFFNTTVIEYKK